MPITRSCAGSILENGRRKGRKSALDSRRPMVAINRQKELWSLSFVSNSPLIGRGLCILRIVDDFTQKAFAAAPNPSISGYNASVSCRQNGKVCQHVSRQCEVYSPWTLSRKFEIVGSDVLGGIRMERLPTLVPAARCPFEDRLHELTTEGL